MAKYDPLRKYLCRRREEELELSFAEIERILGAMLPNSAAGADWWSDGVIRSAGDVQRNAWRDAGYAAVLLPGRERVLFKRIE